MSSQPAFMCNPDESVGQADQLTLTNLHTCDICKGSRIETDPETQLERPCRVCRATGLLDYEPPTGDNPFQGLE